MYFTLSTLSALAAALAVTTTAAMPYHQRGATILLTTNNDAPFTKIQASLGAITLNEERVLRATVESTGRNPWCAGFSDDAATQFIQGSNGDGIINSLNTAVYSNTDFGVEVKAFWCAETKPEVQAFIASRQPAQPPATPQPERAATILLTTNNDAPFTELQAPLGAITLNTKRVLRAAVRSQGRNPWCAGFSDVGATHFVRGSNGDGIFNSVGGNTAVYSNTDFGAEIKSFWCAETKADVQAFIASRQ